MVLGEYYTEFRLLFKKDRPEIGFTLFVFLVFFPKKLRYILLSHEQTIKPRKNFFR